MRAGIAVAVALVGITFSSIASAYWSATIQDDIFSGGKKAMLLGDISPGQTLAFDCDASDLSIALLQKSKWPEGRESSSWKLLIKVDQGEIHKFTAESSKRNEDYIQYSTNEREEILKVLSELRDAKSSVQLGIQSNEFESKWAGAMPVSGSTRETDRFMQACKLK
ncbi:hypothetical protein JFU49_26560 [Pseudomonas sp. TH03]|uniref:hypothetical protein n=1 Tax=Pseudomonas sp. TH03 TaxID=2796369 RepID=UPI00191413A4|nr:hypothetical protein [Pseudomonas sp. TH03]MBK5553815.1 hypothetical protein [Pseudomonas sp. TH03]